MDENLERSVDSRFVDLFHITDFYSLNRTYPASSNAEGVGYVLVNFEGVKCQNIRPDLIIKIRGKRDNIASFAESFFRHRKYKDPASEYRFELPKESIGFLYFDDEKMPNRTYIKNLGEK